MDTDHAREALKRAIEFADGPTNLGRLLGVSKQAVCQWPIAPAKRVIPIEVAIQGRVTRHELRPDLYPPEPAETREQTNCREVAG